MHIRVLQQCLSRLFGVLEKLKMKMCANMVCVKCGLYVECTHREKIK